MPAYAPIWKKRSYGGHTGDETVIRIGTRVPVSVPISVPATRICDVGTQGPEARFGDGLTAIGAGRRILVSDVVSYCDLRPRKISG